ncbi:MAG: adenylate/guanylate cyclase domain-containing protein [Planctomycetes bacterium]|nr:adenylate/guanylate cyclase domain-containing protein [Planctomycetota bacterium]
MADQTAPYNPAAKRTLAAIVFTDVVGFSSLMETNEDKTLQLVNRDLDIFKTVCQDGGGKVLKTTGDGLLMYFDSAVQAVACALHAQQSIANQARSLPADQVLQHRIGIHLGDVFVSATDVMGDGVNVAARLQAEAEPNGICISQTVYDVVKNRLGVQATYLGPRDLKNIAEAVPVYQILLEAQGGQQGQQPPRPVVKKKPAQGGSSGGPVAAVLVVAVLALVGLIVYMAMWGPWSKGPQNNVATLPTPPASQPVIIVQIPTQPVVQQPATVQVVVVRDPNGGQNTQSQPKGPSQADLTAARKSYLGRYDFAGMQTWLEGREMKDSELYAKYGKLGNFMFKLQAAIRTADKTRPVIVESSGGRYEVWGSTGGLSIKGPDGMKDVTLNQLPPALVLELANAMLAREPMLKKGLGEQVQIFSEEMHLAGLAK